MPWPVVRSAARRRRGVKPAVPPAEEKAPPANVKWEGPVQGALEEWTEMVGTTTRSPDRVARVTAPVEGQRPSGIRDADGKPVTEGQQVAGGTVLVQLDPTVVRAAFAKADAGQEVLKEEQRQARFAVDLARPKSATAAAAAMTRTWAGAGRGVAGRPVQGRRGPQGRPVQVPGGRR